MRTTPERVAWLRDAAALHKRSLSKLAGLNPSHVRLLENSTGDRIGRRTAEALARVLGVELAWLMLGIGPCVAAAPHLNPERPAHREALTLHVRAAVASTRAALADEQDPTTQHPVAALANHLRQRAAA